MPSLIGEDFEVSWLPQKTLDALEDKLDLSLTGASIWDHVQEEDLLERKTVKTEREALKLCRKVIKAACWDEVEVTKTFRYSDGWTEHIGTTFNEGDTSFHFHA